MPPLPLGSAAQVRDLPGTVGGADRYERFTDSNLSFVLRTTIGLPRRPLSHPEFTDAQPQSHSREQAVIRFGPRHLGTTGKPVRDHPIPVLLQPRALDFREYVRVGSNC